MQKEARAGGRPAPDYDFDDGTALGGLRTQTLPTRPSEAAALYGIGAAFGEQMLS